MTEARRRRAWRWAVAVWGAAVAVGGGMTLWLQDAEPPGPYIGEVREPTAYPSLPEGWGSQCPSATPPPGGDGSVVTLCVISTG